jgi:hypothetical protein
MVDRADGTQYRCYPKGGLNRYANCRQRRCLLVTYGARPGWTQKKNREDGGELIASSIADIYPQPCHRRYWVSDRNGPTEERFTS